MEEDTSLLIAIFNTLGVLAEKLLGQTLIARIQDAEGHSYYIYPSDYNVIFADGREEALSQFDLTSG